MSEDYDKGQIYHYIEETYGHFGPSTEDKNNTDSQVINCGGGADGLGGCGGNQENTPMFNLDMLPKANVPEEKAIEKATD